LGAQDAGQMARFLPAQGGPVLPDFLDNETPSRHVR
jgi:hypothetical protein